MNDLIERQSVLNACEQSINILEAVDRIMDLPFVEREPCEDAISREAALEKMADYVASGYADSAEDFEEYSRIICQLPSVNPQPKTGHWIWCVGSHKCSNCEEYTCFSHKELLRYCPNCGARMVGEQESEEQDGVSN